MPAKSAKLAAQSAASTAALGFPASVPAADDGATSSSGLQRLESAVTQLRALSVAPMLRRAIDALHAEDVKTGCDWAIKALNQDPNSGMAWYVLAVAREKAGDFANSLKAYQAALQLLPEQSDVANDLGRLAYRMGMKDVAEQLFRRYFAAHPDSLDAANNLAGALRDLGRGDEAIEIVKAAIKIDPTNPPLWNTLGTILAERGDPATALTFFDEAVRLDPAFGRARYNRGNAHLSLGDLGAALADCETAWAGATTPDDKAMMRLARSTIKIGLGRIGEGWDDYEARLDPHFAGGTAFVTKAAAWTPDTPLVGQTLLVMGEQGLGDEVLFANMLPDVLEALGPDGRMIIAVEPRLVSLFQRSFPTTEVVPHSTYAAAGRIYRGAVAIDGRDDIDLWAPMASLLRRFRRSLADFPDRRAFLTPDPARVTYWKAELAKAPAGRKVGILWKSMRLDAARARYYSPFQLWAPVLQTPGVTFVNVQYGDCQAEIDWAAQNLGVQLWTPPGIDLRADLDDIAALTSALDLTLGFANATSNIAAACGAPTWIISVPGAWTRLGTGHTPWYPASRTFLPASIGDWEPTMAEVAQALQTP